MISSRQPANKEEKKDSKKKANHVPSEDSAQMIERLLDEAYQLSTDLKTRCSPGLDKKEAEFVLFKELIYFIFFLLEHKQFNKISAECLLNDKISFWSLVCKKAYAKFFNDENKELGCEYLRAILSQEYELFKKEVIVCRDDSRDLIDCLIQRLLGLEYFSGIPIGSKDIISLKIKDFLSEKIFASNPS